MIDFYASETRYVDHLLPVYRALSSSASPRFVTPLGLTSYLRARQVEVGQHRPGAARVVASYVDQKRARARGSGPLVRIEHGAGQSYAGVSVGNYAGGGDCRDVTLFLCPNEYSAGKWRETYPRTEVAVVGSPKLDDLPRHVRADTPAIAVSFHWECQIAPETRSAFRHYAPVLPDLAKSFDVLGHGHPLKLPVLAGYYKRFGIVTLRDFRSVLAAADVYVCDNSSTLFEFAATGRPVVVLNAPWYRREVRHGGRFWDWASVGIQVDEPADLAGAIEEALVDAPAVRRRRAQVVREVYGQRGSSARLAAAVIEGHLVRREAAA